MARPRKTQERRRELIPVVARAFGELGYRRATTAEIARRCAVQENILYRLWPDKKAMFIAAIDHVYQLASGIWEARSRRGGASSVADLLRYESEHLGEFGNYRIIFAGLSETDDPEIREALATMYRRFHAFIGELIAGGTNPARGKSGTRGESRAHADSRARGVDAAGAAWALIGLGTISTIGKEVGVLGAAARRRLLVKVGGLLAGLGKDRDGA